MNEVKLRVIGFEAAFREVAVRLDPQALDRADRSIRAVCGAKPPPRLSPDAEPDWVRLNIGMI